MYKVHDKTERQIKIIYWTLTEISKAKCSEGRVICVAVLAIGVSVSLLRNSQSRVPTR